MVLAAREPLFVRRFTAVDTPDLAGFACVMMPKAWERDVDDVVHALPDLLRSGRVDALGGYTTDGHLGALIAWSADTDRTDTWFSIVLAVRLGLQHKGYGRQMKAALIEAARSVEGVEFIRSVVHRDNKAMIALNESIGATGRPLVDDPARLHLSFVLRI